MKLLFVLCIVICINLFFVIIFHLLNKTAASLVIDTRHGKRIIYIYSFQAIVTGHRTKLSGYVLRVFYIVDTNL